MLGRIKKSFVLFNCKLMRSLYLTFIRPYLEFAVSVWCPFLKIDIDMIEQVQQRATKLSKKKTFVFLKPFLFQKFDFNCSYKGSN